jgi:hypothetical protein
MTRRLESMDRVRGLVDASVPFPMTSTPCFSDDAVTLETELLRAFAARRQNLAHPRREFFFATPEEVRDVLAEKLACRRRRSARQLTGGGERARPRARSGTRWAGTADRCYDALARGWPGMPSMSRAVPIAISSV